ncbi:DUF6575 domain-containing protein [Vibrio crassostreae]|uniref:DUF6575 domain-containing protein n=1 Tax=Vibrio crassostreae TaxID=246167 RepID=A0A822MWU5_9VIBR|nr:DUF6575 domain-containing protein [Vibrio crassostreae]MDH5950387.1 hypothetical protein [Vibrio crassostreae]TCN06174.1 hypothetical protein EDB35_114153 [Vibrio crassostreae]TCU05416.1 hypothetical protein EDB32_1163 [Vibrio crassostreae]CAK1770637.1 DUF6575 domain-containing protein [Vibrio crassostreae]CAK1777798.1 DUF6575 domain-containing protein [Vibrio crassostreae]
MTSNDLLKLELSKLKPFEIFDYFDGPRFYSCKSPTNQLYLVFWVDETDNGADQWVYIKISSDRYYAMRNRNISIQETFLAPEDGYSLFVSVAQKNDFTIEHILPEQYDEEWFSDEPEFIELEDLSNVNMLPQRQSEPEFASSASNRHVIDLSIINQNNSYEISANALGTILTKYQGFIDALSCDTPNAKRVPEDLKEKQAFHVTNVYAGSFGVRLQSKYSELFPNPVIETTIEKAISILNGLGSADELSKNISEMNLLTRSRFKGLLKGLVDNKLSLSTDYGNPDGRRTSIKSNYTHLQYALNNLVNCYSSDSEDRVLLNVTLVGVDVNSDFFAIKLTDGQIIKGKLSKDLEASNFTVPSTLNVLVKETCKANDATDEEKWTYILKEVLNN